MSKQKVMATLAAGNLIKEGIKNKLTGASAKASIITKLLDALRVSNNNDVEELRELAWDVSEAVDEVLAELDLANNLQTLAEEQAALVA